jgi:hypothetical protein
MLEGLRKGAGSSVRGRRTELKEQLQLIGEGRGISQELGVVKS